MRFKITIFLLLANLATFGLIWKMERERGLPPTSGAPVFAANIQRIAVRGPGVSHPYVLEKGQQGWRVLEPFKWAAADRAVERVLEQLRFLQLDRSFTVQEAKENGSELSAYGLDQPEIVLEVSDGAKEPVRVSIGVPKVEGNSVGPVYLLTPGERIIPATRALLEDLMVAPEQLRSTRVFALAPFEVSDVTVWNRSRDGKEQHTGLRREQMTIPGEVDLETVWRFEAPLEADADGNLVQAQLVRLTQLDYDNFTEGTAERLEQSGLATPAMRIALVGGTRQQTLLVGQKHLEARVPRYYAKLSDNPAIFTVDAAAIDSWRDAVGTLRDRRFLRFHPSLLREITVHIGGNSLALHRRTEGGAPAGSGTDGLGDWIIPMVPGTTATVTLAADAKAMANLIGALRNLSAEDFVPEGEVTAAQQAWIRAFVSDVPSAEDLAALKLNRPECRVELGFSEGGSRVLLLASPNGAQMPYHAKLDGRPSVYSVGPMLRQQLSVDPNFYRTRVVEQLADDVKLTALTLTDLATGRVLLKENRVDPAITWEKALATRSAKERAEVLALLGQMRRIAATAFSPEPFSPQFTAKAPGSTVAEGWRYQLDVGVRVPGATVDETRTWFFTRRLGGTEQWAGSPGHGVIFQLEQGLVDALFPVTFGRDRSEDVPAVKPPPSVPAPSAAAFQ